MCDHCNGNACKPHATDCDDRFSDVIRDVSVGGITHFYRLTMAQDGMGEGYNRGRTRVADRLVKLDGPEPSGAPGTLLFEGTEFYPSPFHADDSDNAVACLLSFLTLKPGDTDPEYFAGYTQAQLEWCASDDAEELAFMASEFEDSGVISLHDWEG